LQEIHSNLTDTPLEEEQKKKSGLSTIQRGLLRTSDEFETTKAKAEIIF
jgi:hypothetical protein